MTKGRTAPFADQRDADAWAARVLPDAPIKAPAVAGLNLRTREACMEVLDLADRAGVTIGLSVFSSRTDPGAASAIYVQGGAGGGHLTMTEACAMVLANGPSGRSPSSVTRIPATETCPQTGLEFRLYRCGVPVTVICEPTWEGGQ